MKLIIERLGEEFFAYREQENHFKQVEKFRKTRGKRKRPEVLDEECSLSMVLDDEDYIVVEI